MIPSLEGWPSKAKEAPSPHEVSLTPLDTNPLFQCLQVEPLTLLPLILFTINTVNIHQHCLPSTLFTIITIYHQHCLPSTFTSTNNHQHCLPSTLLPGITQFSFLKRCYIENHLGLSYLILKTTTP